MKSNKISNLQFIKQVERKITTSIIIMESIIINSQYIYADESGSVAAPAVGSGDVSVPLTAIKTIGLSFVSGLGVIVAIKGISILGKGIKERDSNGIAAGAAELGGGAIMAGCGAVLALMGF